MRWTHAAAAMAGRVSARTIASRGFASGGGARREWRPAAPQAWEWLRRLWSGERRKQQGAAKRSVRRAAELRHEAELRRAAKLRGDVMVLLRDFARSFVASKVAELTGGGGTASKEDPVPAHVQAKPDPLLSRAKLLITRKVEWASVMFSYAQETRYIIKDPRTPQEKTASVSFQPAPGSIPPVGFIREKSNFILRQLLRSRRPFVAKFTDAKGNEIFTVRRPFRWINSSIYAEVDGKEVGVVHSRWHLWRRNYDLYLGNRQFAVVENRGLWHWSFVLVDEYGMVLAIIDRKLRGFGMEIFTSAAKYEIRFGDVGKSCQFIFSEDMEDLRLLRPLDLPERAVTLALAVSLDHDCFSRSLGWGLRIFE